MPLALAWFLGSVFMLAGVAGAWVTHRANVESREALRSRMRTAGTITRVEPPTVDDFGLQSCTVEYVVDGHSYQTSAEVERKDGTMGRPLELMALPKMPSDAVLLRDLDPASFRKPAVFFCVGAVLVAWGYIDALSK